MFSQEQYLPINRDFTLRYEPCLYKVNSEIHTAVRPFISSEVEKCAPLDSLNTNFIKDSKFNKTWVGRKLWKEHLFEIKGEDYTVNLDPAVEFRETHDEKNNYFTNTRGFWVSGTFGKRFSYSSAFFESQSKFPSYIDSLVRFTRVIPGGARTKKLYGNYDYAIASGTVSYSLKKYFNFQFGHDKVFIGDGYR